MDLAHNLEVVRDRITQAGGENVGIVAVTKGFGVDAVQAAIAAGLTDVGENYAQELIAKHGELGQQPRWHFIGQLQSNKVRQLADIVDVWQTVDSTSLVKEIAKRAPGAKIFVQVNLSADTARGGCGWEEAPLLIEQARTAQLDVRGLMAVGPLAEPEDARSGFKKLAQLQKSLELPELSIGMSQDLEVAVQEGATVVRVGGALFGTRSK